MQIASPSGLRQIGSGVPQKRLREMAQSRAFSSHLPNRPSRRCSGTQEVALLASTSCSLIASTFTNQVDTAR